MIPVQDYLGLGNRARINEPSTLGKNWRWRMKTGDLTEEILERCRQMAEQYSRVPEDKQEDEPEKDLEKM